MEVEAAVAGKTTKVVIGTTALLALTVFLYFAFSGAFTINPVIFRIGVSSVKWYGALIASAVYLSYRIISKRYAKIFSDDNFDYIFLVVLLFGLIGARIGFVIQNVGYFSENLSGLVKIYEGGLSIHGGIIGGILGLLLITRQFKMNFVKVSNIMSPEVLLSIAIGRFGNFFNQEIIGMPTNGIIKMFVQPTNRPLGFEDISFFHPVFLYESIILFALYLYLTSNSKRVENGGAAYLLVGYCITRICVEFFRIDYKPIFLAFDLAQLVSFGIIAITIATLTFRQK